MIRFGVLLGVGLLLSSAGAVEIRPRAAGGYDIAARTYAATLNASGNLASLWIAEVEFLERATTNFAGQVTQDGTTLIARGEYGSARYAFDDTGFKVSTEGVAITYRLAAGITALITQSGEVTPLATGVADVRKVVRDASAFSISESFHSQFGDLYPSLLARGGKPQTPFAYRIECGVPVVAAELVSILSVTTAGMSPATTPRFTAAKPPQADLRLLNRGTQPARVTVPVRVFDQTAGTSVVWEATQSVVVPAGQTNVVSIAVPLATPGLYWLQASVQDQDRSLQTARWGFLYEAEAYRPPLTRPSDFRAFWEAQLKAMRAIPFAAELIEMPALGNDRFRHYHLAINGPDGKRVETFLRLPRAPGPHDAEVVSYWGSTPIDRVVNDMTQWEAQPAGVGMWQRGADRIRVGAPQPEDSTYQRWVNRTDNNYRDSYLMNVRLADYLRQRPDVKNLWLFGASRSGASMLAAAALAPERVVAVNVHVPTSCGLSWPDQPYRGWGNVPPTDAAYFDVTNFAPDLTVPVVMDGGLFDDLAPAAGILAFCNAATRSPFRSCSIILGGHGYFPPEPRQQMEQDLTRYLESRRP